MALTSAGESGDEPGGGGHVPHAMLALDITLEQAQEAGEIEAVRLRATRAPIHFNATHAIRACEGTAGRLSQPLLKPGASGPIGSRRPGDSTVSNGISAHRSHAC